MWIDVDNFDRIKLETKNGKVSVYRKFAERLAVQLGLLKEPFFPTYISMPVQVDVPEELVNFLKCPIKVLEIAKDMGYNIEISDWEDKCRTPSKWRNYWVFAPPYSGRLSEYVYTEDLTIS